MGMTLLCALYLSNPIDLGGAQNFNYRFKSIRGFKLISAMICDQRQRKSISEILSSI